MPGKDDLTIQGKKPPSAGTNSSPEHPASPGESPNSPNNLIVPKLPVVRTRPRARLRKSIHPSAPQAPREIPCSWVPSNRELLEECENNRYLQLYGTKSGLHLPDIVDKKAARNMMRIRPKTPQIRTIHVNAADEAPPPPVTLPTLTNVNVDPREMYMPRPPSHRSPLLAPQPPVRSPFDLSDKSPCDICDPAREYRDNARDIEGQADTLPPISMLRHVPRPPSQPNTDNGRRPPRHLPPLALRQPRERHHN